MSKGIGPERLDKLAAKGMEESKKRRAEEAKKPKKQVDPKFQPVIGRVTGGVSPQAVIRCLDDVEAKPIRWLWPGRIACGKLSLIAGDPGLGKSQVTIAMAATVTRGGIWPVDGIHCQQGAVLFLSSEDDAADTIRPRLEAVGADLRQCFIIDAVRASDETGTILHRSFSLKHDLARLAETMASLGNVRLIIIDPITAYMGSVDSHKNTDVRSMLMPIAELAEDYAVAILGVSHLNKSNAQDALQRVTGSGAFVATARAGLVVVKDKANPARRLLLPIKNNLAKDVGGLAFSVQTAYLENGIETSRVEWEEEPVIITADEAMRIDDGQDRSREREEAKRFLADLLAEGPVMAGEAERQYQESGISTATIRRAKKDLGVTSQKSETGWIWALPKVLNKGEKQESCKTSEHLEHLQSDQLLTEPKNADFSQGAHLKRLSTLNKTDLQGDQNATGASRQNEGGESSESDHLLTF